VDAEGFNGPEGNMKSSVMARMMEIHRSLQAVACRKRYVRELGKPHKFLLDRPVRKAKNYC
jgi:hypothetical protein